MLAPTGKNDATSLFVHDLEGLVNAVVERDYLLAVVTLGLLAC